MCTEEDKKTDQGFGCAVEQKSFVSPQNPNALQQAFRGHVALPSL